MPPSVCTREHIRWLPGPATEPTSTLVLTSNDRHFVDLRILTPPVPGTDPTPFEGIQPLSHLDWAFAGTSVTYTRPDRNGGTRLHAVWRHFVDSRTADAPEEVVDEGEIVPQPGGSRTLEYGRMVNPASGKVEGYEEAWRDLEPEPAAVREEGKGWEEEEKGEEGGTGEVRCVVLKLQDDEKGQRGVVVRVGRWCQGIVRAGGGVSLERWEWGVEAGWKRKVRMGDMWLPCGVAMDPERIMIGGEVRHGEQVWEGVELTEGE